MVIYIFQCYSLKSSHPHLLPQSPKVCSFYLCLFCCLMYKVVIIILLNSICMWYYIVLVSFFLTSFTLYNRLQFHPPHQNWSKCVLFNSWVIFHSVYAPQLPYPLICQWTSRLLSCPSYYKSAAMNIGVHESLSVLVSSVRMPSSGIAGSYGTLLGRKVMTNLDSILKSRDTALPKKVRLAKAIVFPVVMYGCESWTIKKAECWRIAAVELCGVGEDSWESLGLQGDPTSPS